MIGWLRGLKKWDEREVSGASLDHLQAFKLLNLDADSEHGQASTPKSNRSPLRVVIDDGARTEPPPREAPVAENFSESPWFLQGPFGLGSLSGSPRPQAPPSPRSLSQHKSLRTVVSFLRAASRSPSPIGSARGTPSPTGRSPGRASRSPVPPGTTRDAAAVAPRPRSIEPRRKRRQHQGIVKKRYWNFSEPQPLSAVAELLPPSAGLVPPSAGLVPPSADTPPPAPPASSLMPQLVGPRRRGSRTEGPGTGRMSAVLPGLDTVDLPIIRERTGTVVMGDGPEPDSIGSVTESELLQDEEGDMDNFV